MADRRASNDRRRTSDRRGRSRRRKNDQRLFVIELTPNELRIAQLERTADGEADQVEASSMPWRRQAARLQTPEGLAELTVALREAARRHSMFGADVRLVLSGEYCIMRVVRGAVEDVRAELGRLEQRS